MSLRSSVETEDAIVTAGDASGRTWTVNDTSAAAIAESSNGNGIQYTYREARSSTHYKWLALTLAACQTYQSAHLFDSAGTLNVLISFSRDMATIAAYTLERSEETVVSGLVSKEDIPDEPGA